VQEARGDVASSRKNGAKCRRHVERRAASSAASLAERFHRLMYLTIVRACARGRPPLVLATERVPAERRMIGAASD